jgi:hypothetical protein
MSKPKCLKTANRKPKLFNIFFYYLCAAIATQGKPLVTTPIFLGDRVDIQSFRIESGKIVIKMLVQGPKDGACCPTMKKTLIYKVNQGKLIGSAS